MDVFVDIMAFQQLCESWQYGSKVRRNLSNISQSDFGKVIVEDVSRKTVSRCEMRCGAALVASARHFYACMKQDLLDLRSNENPGFGLFFHAYRQDATNGKQKFVAVELHSSCLCNVDSDEASSLSWKCFRRIRRLADLGLVGDESGVGCVGVTLRGFRCLGCPSWRDLNIMQDRKLE